MEAMLGMRKLDIAALELLMPLTVGARVEVLPAAVAARMPPAA